MPRQKGKKASKPAKKDSILPPKKRKQPEDTEEQGDEDEEEVVVSSQSSQKAVLPSQAKKAKIATKKIELPEALLVKVGKA